ncbi:acyl-CoA dehydrogenase [Rhizocola hellebori]|uniref:Acyl-CoA dehydrogenase n=1 Tax=Rhizocola hellebori TaxID=1392758 RepID=A0A8J3QIT3_9ACTN|nr:phosphotransferase family protein [Rhizocola hellebori]GIH10417.1 acyl-CoA dehydrogenase [Rhizocola hellebori]
MTLPPGLDLDAASRLIGMELSGGELIAGGKSNLTYRVSGPEGEWVVRRPPLGHVLSTAHDMAREFRVISALGPTNVPVPQAIALSEDPSFYVMGFVPGPVYRTAEALGTLGPRRIERLMGNLVDVLVELHSVDPASVGLSDFGRPDGYLERQLRRWQKQYESSRSRQIDGVDELHDLLVEKLPASSKSSIVHGDYRIDNCISSEEDTIAAVLDWEMSTLGDPLTDVGLLLMYWRLHIEDVALPPGAPTSAELAQQYAVKRGLDLAELDWYLAFANYKLAVIAEGIHFRYQAGQTVGEGFADMGPLVPRLIAQGHDALRGQ